MLDEVLVGLDHRSPPSPEVSPLYDQDLIELRDQIATARLEDVPPLLEHMERLQSLAARRRGQQATSTAVDARSPYFGHLVLEEAQRRREILIGRATFLDTERGIRIVDWRDAPVSRLYYRYEEGDEYDEVFADREVTGRVLTRRSVAIVERELRRIQTPRGAFARQRDGRWRALPAEALRLQGGQGAAIRAEQHRRPGRLGIGGEEGAEDKHLREITALIDRRQFELITRPDSGLVVVQGGAGSGKTTIGLHRLAYLAFQDRRRFRPDRMLVIVFNDALARYISLVLPALDVEGVPIRTFESWAMRLRRLHLPRLPRRYAESTPVEVTRVKKHPAMLAAIDAFVAGRAAAVEGDLERILAPRPGEAALPLHEEFWREWRRSEKKPLSHRLHALAAAAGRYRTELKADVRIALDHLATEGIRASRDVATAWAELLTDRTRLERAFADRAPEIVDSGDLGRALAWCVARCAEIETNLDASETVPLPEENERPEPTDEPMDGDQDQEMDDDLSHGIDGRELDELAALDREDDALLLRLYQRLRGPLLRGGRRREALVYEHVLVDEAQDLSPVELSVVLGTVGSGRSLTFAGDVAQRLHIDNGFTDWRSVLRELDLEQVEIEPLHLSYRSTLPIIELAQAVLGPLAPPDAPVATRDGAPVEIFAFGHQGDAVAFLGEALRDLMQQEPRASVAVIVRYPEQADLFYEGLKKAEVPLLRRIAEQDFPFRPGVDVTDVRQVKGLEFDYVVLAEVTDAAYPAEDEARHLLHIAVTRAAHQLWVLTSSRPSPLLPDELLERAS
ncbi:MAG: ATP-binding domain-containing protein [Polyangiaceae bacterium]|nr:ATP-binding domain-containing protein [Polyangiaceae bacterium]